MIRMVRALFLACVAVLAGASDANAAGSKLVVLPFDLIDDSQEGEAFGVREDETKRLELVTRRLEEYIREDGRYVLVDSTPIAAEIEQKAPIYKCNGCEDALAAKLGADLAIIGNVQKVSNLILNLNVYLRDVKSGKILNVWSTDIRGNTDESWLRGIKSLAQNRLLAKEEPPK
jgi:hypothetical protein